MATIDEITREISVMVPKLMKGAKGGILMKGNITSAQMIMLVAIHDYGRCKANMLARARGISPPTATHLIDRLVRSGYVKRGPDTKDRRAVILSLTKKGENAVQNFLSTVRKRWRKILVHLTPEEQYQYLNILKKIVSVLQEKEG